MGRNNRNKKEATKLAEAKQKGKDVVDDIKDEIEESIDTSSEDVSKDKKVDSTEDILADELTDSKDVNSKEKGGKSEDKDSKSEDNTSKDDDAVETVTAINPIGKLNAIKEGFSGRILPQQAVNTAYKLEKLILEIGNQDYPEFHLSWTQFINTINEDRGVGKVFSLRHILAGGEKWSKGSQSRAVYEKVIMYVYARLDGEKVDFNKVVTLVKLPESLKNNISLFYK